METTAGASTTSWDEVAELDNAYQEVLSQLGKGRYPRITPKRFTERYKSIWQLL
jgi:hypothetical protein